MTRERSPDLLLVAIILSVAVHVGLMFFVRARVMTHVDRSALRAQKHEVMRVTDYTPLEDPVSIERIKDIISERDAPEAEADEPVKPVTEQLPDNAAKHWNGEVPAPEAPSLDAVPKPTEDFDVRPVELAASADPEPLPTIDYTPPESRTLAAPDLVPAADFALPAAFGSSAPAQIAAPVAETGPIERMLSEGRSAVRARVDFVPAEEVYGQVDERIVEREKEAVRELMEVDDAAPLEKFVNLSATRSEDAEWTYFRLFVSPRSTLAVVPKDVVVLLDASGSIGSERLTSCRTAVKGILRSAFNGGDRFNLVAFRNNFTYAFRRWQPCDKASFDAADRWLSNLTAHGRTDVFATIRSVLTLPRDPARPLVALVVTDGDANAGVRDTAEILSKFTALNDGLVSVYMYGVKEGANRQLIDVLTHGNRGESFIFGGLRWKAGSGIESLSERFRDPVLSDLRVIFSAATPAEAYPRLLKNLCRGDSVTLVGRVPKSCRTVAFSLKGLSGSRPYEAFFRVNLDGVASDPGLARAWAEESAIDAKLR